MKKTVILIALTFSVAIVFIFSCQKQTPDRNPFANNNWPTPLLPPPPVVAPTGTVGFWTTNTISWTSNFKIFVSIDNKIKIVDDVYYGGAPYDCGDTGGTTDFDLANGHYRWRAWINDGVTDTITGYVTIKGACVLERIVF